MMSTLTHSTHRERLKRFLYDKIENLEQLAILTWLRTHGERSWPVEAIAVEVHLPVAVSALALDRLHSRGLVEQSLAPPPQFRFQAEDQETAELVELLILNFERDPASMVALMGSSAIERIRSAAWQTFADCVKVASGKQKE